MSTKPERERFAREAEKTLRDYGAVVTELHRPGEYSLLTQRFGRLKLWLFPGSDRRILGQVFGRFVEPDRAEALHCNPFSGKWNHHYFHETPTEALEDMRGWLDLLTEPDHA